MSSFMQNKFKYFLTLFMSLGVALPGFAKSQYAPVKSSISDPTVLTMVILMFVLLLIIALLANVLIGASRIKTDEIKKTDAGKVALLIGALFVSPALFAQETTEAVAKTVLYPGGLSATAFYVMISVLVIELMVILYLLVQIKIVLSKNFGKETAPKKSIDWAKLWNKLNKFKSKEEEAGIVMEHEYDGIRELDNRLPPWWLYGFYFTIIFSVVYLWRYHVAESAPLSHQEYEISVAEAKIRQEAYLKNAANNVDENSVVYIDDASQLALGQKVFIDNCSACHGKVGEGNAIGPNLTDDYWIHGGSMADIFKSIKYGWPDKGMRSWQEDLSPVQMAQIASFIKSIKGSNPPNAKEPQGELYTEEVPDNPSQE
jgi:cytochrome c oxidase cbb3-type subunit 3